ncbi:hypothetical protein ACB092_02G192800 [Castanea dentata]
MRPPSPKTKTKPYLEIFLWIFLSFLLTFSTTKYILRLSSSSNSLFLFNQDLSLSLSCNDLVENGFRFSNEFNADFISSVTSFGESLISDFEFDAEIILWLRGCSLVEPFSTLNNL